jgi:tRNA A-37 threonylcarbamoyl transferase component Bud32
MEQGSDLLVGNLLYNLPKFEEETNLVKTVGHKDFLLFFKVMYNIYVTDYRVIITDGFTDKEIRSIAIGNLAGITKSCISNYIVFHCERDFDEMLEVTRKDDIIEMTKLVYSNLTKKNLAIFEVNENKLDDYVTTQSDVDNDITRMPDRSTRLRTERLVYDSSSSEEEGEGEEQEQEQDKENQQETLEDFNLKKTPPKRKKEGEGMVELYNKSDAIGIEQKDMNSGGNSEMIFSRNKKIAKENKYYSKTDDRKFKYQDENYEVIEEQVEEIEIVNDNDELSFEANDYDEEKEYTPKLEDFKIIKVLDKGSFGKVFLVENKFNGKYYAMKRIRKDVLIEKKQIENTKNEKKILLNLEHPFLLGMSYVIQNDLRIYFFLDFIEGGNLYQNLFKVKRFPEQTVKFFAAQLVLAFGVLHDEMIVHRDLKPENVLLGSDGYIKLADFGLAKSLSKHKPLTYSFCGTTEYLAPEIIKDEGHSFTVDWWTLGILIYELRTGRTPFLHKNTHQTTKLIKSGKIIFPDPIKHKIDMTEEMKDIISGLLEKDPKRRLGHNGK